MRKFDRRALIFWVFSLVCLVLLIPCPEDFHNVGITLTVVYALLGTASWADSASRQRRRGRA